MPLVNVTTHAIKIMRPDGTLTVLPPSGIVARVSVELTPVGEADCVPVLGRLTCPVKISIPIKPLLAVYAHSFRLP